MKKTFLIFLLVFSALFAGTIAVIQSRYFAAGIQKSVEKLIPSDAGLRLTFEGIRIQAFPPRIAVVNPQVELGEKHRLDVPFRGALRAERLELTPDFLSLFGQELRIRGLTLINSESEWTYQESLKTSKDPKKGPILWKDLLKIPLDAVEIRDSKVSLNLSSGNSMKWDVEQIRLSQGTAGAPIPVARTLIARALPAVVEFEWESRIRTWTNQNSVLAEGLIAEASISSRGATLKRLQLQSLGLHLDLAGVVEGDILPLLQGLGGSPIRLPAKAAGTLSLELEGLAARTQKVLEPLSKTLSKQVTEVLADIPSGGLKGEFQLKSNLSKWRTESSGEWKLQGERLKAFGWDAEKFTSSVSLSGDLTDPEIRVRDLEVTSGDRARVGGVQAGRSGKVRVGQWGSTWKKLMSGFEIPLQLESAHSNWLAGPEVSTFFSLNTELTGNLMMTFRPATERTPWRLQFSSQSGVVAPRAVLDNQTLEKKGVPLSSVLDLKSVLFKGSIVADPNEVRIDEGTTLSIGKSRLSVAGVYDFKKGFDIRGTAPLFSMKDVGTIGGIPVQGEGSLGLHVKGPSERVILDFFPDLQGMKYLSLDFGHIQGTLSLDVETEEVFLRKGELRYPQSVFSLEGVVGLHGRGNLSLDLGVKNGDIRDVLGMFKDLTEDVSWYPRNLSGPVSGTARISGGLSMEELVVHTELEGQDWTDYGERFREVRLVGGYYEGKYELKSVQARKGSGLIQAHVGFVDQTQEINWSIESHDLRVSDIDFLARLDVPMRGTIRVMSEGKGVLGQVTSKSEIEVTDTIIRGLAFPPSRLGLDSADGRLRVQGIGFGGQAQLNYESSLARQPATVKVDLNRFDFSPLLLLVNPKLMQDRSLLGMVTAKVNLTYPGEDLRFASGNIRFDQYALAKSGVRLDLSHPVTVNLAEGAFHFRDAELKGKESLLKVEGDSDGKKIDLDVSGSLELAVMEFLSPVMEQTKGLLRFQGGVRGKTDSPDVYGQGELEGASTRVVALDAPLENLRARFQMEKGLLRLQDLSADLSGGRVRGAGTVDFFLDHVPTVQIQGSIDGSKLKVPPLHYVKVSGTVKMSGDRLPYLASGSIVTDSALYREKFSSGSGGKVAGGSVATRFLPPPTSRYSVTLPFMEYDVAVRADKGMFVQNDLVDSEWKGNLRITGDPDHPSVLGTAELISGKMLFKDRAFQMQSGQVFFDTPYEINPRFSVVGQAEVSDYRVQISVSGRPETLRIGLSSNPVLPESELITLLALGGTSSVGTGGRLTDRTVVQTAEAASLVLQSADFNRSLKDRTGFQLGFDEAVNQEVGSSIFKPRSDGDTTAAAPKIVVKRQIGKKIDVSVGSTVGVGSNSQKEVNAEFKVSPGFSVIGVWDSLDGADAQGRESFGVDLKVQKRFK